MTRVGNTDQVLALIRNQLQRMAKRRPGEKTGKTGKLDTRTLSPQERVRALNAIGDLSDEDFTRDLVRALLGEALGENVTASPEFHAVVERTAATLRADPEIAALLGQVRGGL